MEGVLGQSPLPKAGELSILTTGVAQRSPCFLADKFVSEPRSFEIAEFLKQKTKLSALHARHRWALAHTSRSAVSFTQNFGDRRV
jgi:hypothetical protein